MLDKYFDAQETINRAKVKIHFDRAHSPNNGEARRETTQTPENVINATNAALQDMSEILSYFKDNFLDKEGKIIKVSFWKWIFDKEYRDKLGNAIDYIFGKIKDIASRFAS
jgi:hypothetical protein